MAEVVQPVVRPVVGAVCVGGSQEGGGGPPALTMVSQPSLPVNTLISTANTVTPAVWSQTITNRRFDYFKGSLPTYPSTTGRYRAANTALTHTPQPAPHSDNISVGDTIFVREMVDYGGVTYVADSVGRVVQTATPTPQNTFGRLFPSLAFNAQGASSYPEIICEVGTVNDNRPIANVPESGGFIGHDGQPRIRKTTSSDGYPIIELRHNENDALFSSAQRTELDWWPPNGSALTSANGWYAPGDGVGVEFPYDDAAPIEFWWAVCMRLPDRSSSDPTKLMMQLHQSGATTNPFFSIAQAGNSYSFSQRYNANASPTQATNVVYQDSSFSLPAADQWITFVGRFRLGHTLTGSPSVEWWMNGVKHYDRTGTDGRCGYNQSSTRFQRVGFYPFSGMLNDSTRNMEIRGEIILVGAYSEPFMRAQVEENSGGGSGGGGGGGTTYPSISGSLTASAASGSNANARLTVNPDGTWQFTVASGSGTPSPSGVQEYIDPIVGTPGNSLWIRATIVSGSFSGGPASGVITALTSAVTWNKGSTTGSFSVVFDVEILGDSGGTIVHSTGRVTLGYAHT